MLFRTIGFLFTGILTFTSLSHASQEPGEDRDLDCTEPVPRYRLDTRNLHLSMVRVGESVYAARFDHIQGSSPVKWKLVSVQRCEQGLPDQSPEPSPSYDITTGELLIPKINVRFRDGRTRAYTARLRRVGTQPLILEIVRADPVAGERYSVEDTQYVNTLIGYGEIRARSSYPEHIQSAKSGGDIIWGTDLGLPLTIRGTGSETPDLTLYLFGDTDQLDLQWLEKTRQVRKLSRPPGKFSGPLGTYEGDAIGLSDDADPRDGIHLKHVYRNREPGERSRVCKKVDKTGFRSVYLPGVHKNSCKQTKPEINTTPTGAWTIGDNLFMVAGVQDPDDLSKARSYLAVSTDLGLNWTVLNAGQPFSSGGPQAHFIHAFGLPVDTNDYQDISRSGPCRLPLPEGTDKRGLLLFGSGLWKASDVYLGFISRKDLLDAAENPRHHLSPWYFAGTDYTGPDGGRCWSRSEADARAIITTSDFSAYERFGSMCGSTLISAGTGYTKAIHVDATLDDGTRIDRLIMLLSPAYQGITSKGEPFDADLGTVLVTGDPLRPWIWNLALEPDLHHGRLPGDPKFRPIPVPPDPNSGLEPTRPACRFSHIPWATVSGYAPLLIDRYTRISEDGLGVDLYFLISRSNVPSDPNDDGDETVDSYHYVVDVMRTTLRPAKKE